MSHQITIAWSPSPTPVQGYNVYRGTAHGNESHVPINPTLVTGTSFTDTSVFPGQVYSYAVTAVSGGIESAESIDIVSAPVPFPTSPAPLDLGAAASFGVLGGSTVTNVSSSTTIVSGDVGVSPGTAITGMNAPSAISGVFHPGDFVSAAAQNALTALFTSGMALPGGATLTGDIGGQTLAPGVYVASSSLGITGSLVLDAGGDPNAVWVFQIGSTLTTATSNSAVVLTGGAQAQNVYWLVGSSATLGTFTSFAGVLVAEVSITVTTGVHVNGRLLARTGAVTMDGDSVMSFRSVQLHVGDVITAEGVGFFALLPSPPNVAPPAPSAPLGLHITSEV